MTPARVEAHPCTCATCAHHQRPQWATAGMGTCGEVVRLGHVKTIGAMLMRGLAGGYVATHEAFGCGAWAGRVER
jgi:hypothetical protein